MSSIFIQIPRPMCKPKLGHLEPLMTFHDAAIQSQSFVVRPLGHFIYKPGLFRPYKFQLACMHVKFDGGCAETWFWIWHVRLKLTCGLRAPALEKVTRPHESQWNQQEHCCVRDCPVKESQELTLAAIKELSDSRGGKLDKGTLQQFLDEHFDEPGRQGKGNPEVNLLASLLFQTLFSQLKFSGSHMQCLPIPGRPVFKMYETIQSTKAISEQILSPSMPIRHHLISIFPHKPQTMQSRRAASFWFLFRSFQKGKAA